jgi:hypothetical protein
LARWPVSECRTGHRAKEWALALRIARRTIVFSDKSFGPIRAQCWPTGPYLSNAAPIEPNDLQLKTNVVIAILRDMAVPDL